MAGQDLILFDGDCAYCHGWVKWITARDTQHRFRFVALSSVEGRAERSTHGIPEHLDSIVLVQQGTAYTRSDAGWRVLRGLPGNALWAGLLRAVPRPLRNWGYDLVAKNRHRFGLTDECELPAR
jgi:predicted DCC family thiol-disulfide oxidoreductase YuxK